MPGHLYHERYEILEPLGATADRPIYLAKDRQSPDGSRCVVKQIHPPVPDPAVLERVRDLVTIERLKFDRLDPSLGTPKLLDSFERDLAMYFVYEWIEGISVKAELENHPTYSIDRLRDFLQESLTVLDAVNGNGILHQNITPAQWIYRSSDRKLFLVGLGNIQRLGGDLAVTMPVNERCFFAPEQLRGRPKTNSDLYSLGVIAIQALTGVNPILFEEDERGKMIWESYCRELSPLQEILNRMIDPDGERRYPSPKAALLALEQLRPAPRPTEILSPPPSVSPNVSVPVPSPIPSPSIPSSLPPAVLSPPPTVLSGVSPRVPDVTNAREIPEPTPEPIAPRARGPGRFSGSWRSRLGIGIGIGVAIVVSLFLIARLWEMRKQQQIAAIVDRIEQLDKKGEYEKCIVESNAVETVRAEVPPAIREELASKCILGIAIQQAELSRYNEALKIAVKIPNTSSAYKRAQEYIDRWSSTILDQADRFYRDTGDLEKASEMIGAIPETSSVKKTALNSVAKWQEDYQSKPGKVIIDLCKVDITLCSQ